MMSEPQRLEALEVRVSYLEREQDGEKLVTRHILEQTRRNGDDLAALKTRVDRIERKFDGLDQKFDGLDRKFEAFAADLPKLVAEVLREVLREPRP